MHHISVLLLMTEIITIFYFEKKNITFKEFKLTLFSDTSRTYSTKGKKKLHYCYDESIKYFRNISYSNYTKIQLFQTYSDLVQSPGQCK